ncbi:MAG: bifunctional ADP-dependent NAD(P)H-hydrate dehydratase/NAD(P)H-hydrate epimerase [Hyphomicrobiales bacterium]|nr:MAG: bifunctional ADP-dependent NAD(P)H-hydrate dehydratase/NAD(P)H-hydrate epimerase [Hyphomicrobiales bacterium]
MNELLTSTEMGKADRLAIEGGIPGTELMEAAGRAVAEGFLRAFPDASRIVVLAGPGNNGGDGYVAARYLAEADRSVTVAVLGDPAKLTGDAAWARDGWRGDVVPATPLCLTGAGGVIDALFGAGLTRPIEGEAAELVEAVNASGLPVLAVDLPSGISGETGKAQGVAIRAEATVTFFRKKPGHLLLPGRIACGAVSVHDIGIPAAVLSSIAVQTFENGPAQWLDDWRPPMLDGHKYDRGHAVVVSGTATATGAARLAAGAALRAGAGLVTVASPPDALAVNAHHLTAIMLRSFVGAEGLAALLSDKRLNAVALGPALGVGAETRRLVAAALDGRRDVVLDADALTSFAAKPAELFALIAAQPDRAVVMTPHDGEFARLFPDIAEAAGSKIEGARAAAARSGATVVLKGADTVIASPEGVALVNANAPAWLATAGAGDVLAGIVAGLLAQGMPGLAAAGMAVWLHGETASQFGSGMIAEDLAPALPAVLGGLASLRTGAPANTSA